MYSKKIIVLTLIISMLLSIFVNCISLAAGNIEINMSKENDGSITLKVNAEKNISNISVYLKREGTEYKLFYRSNSVNSKNKTYKISRTRLSTQQETYFKVIVEDEEGTEKSKEFKGEKRTETTKPSTKPAQTQHNQQNLQQAHHLQQQQVQNHQLVQVQHLANHQYKLKYNQLA